MHTAATAATILVVEDSPSLVDLLRQVLGEHGYDVRVGARRRSRIGARAGERCPIC